MTWYIKWKQKSEIEVDQDLHFEHGEIFSFLQGRNVERFLPQKHNLVRVFLAGCCARFLFLMGFSGHVQFLLTLQAESIKFSHCLALSRAFFSRCCLWSFEKRRMGPVKTTDVIPVGEALILLIFSKLQNGGNKKLALSFKSFSFSKIKQTKWQTWYSTAPNCGKYTAYVKIKQ